MMMANGKEKYGISRIFRTLLLAKKIGSDKFVYTEMFALIQLFCVKWLRYLSS